MPMVNIKDSTHEKLLFLVLKMKKKEPDTKTTQDLVIRRGLECLEKEK